MQNISLALSGGGIRAMAFHMGVLHQLAERGLLEQVKKISSVSGGSLLIGLMLKENYMHWPTSTLFLEKTFPRIREKLCTRSLVRSMLKQLLNPEYLPLLIYRANLLAKSLQNDWDITESLGELPTSPEISLNGTTAETGKRFRFKKSTLGDYELGYADGQTFPLAEALAVSAAFPGGIGPLTTKTGGYIWKKRKNWDDPPEAAMAVACEYEKLHLYDGGVYDNLGLEPFFDASSNAPKDPEANIIVSDAGAPYERGFSSFGLNPWRLKRMMDVMSEQTRALRVRGFYAYLEKNKRRGAYIGIQNEVYSSEDKALKQFVCTFPTTLRRLGKSDFDKLAGYGMLMTKKCVKEQGVAR